MPKTVLLNRFNPDVFSPGVKHLNPEGDFFKKQCSLVKDASDFLLNVQIPAFLRECRDHSAAPMDGQTLSDTLHNRGINIRYLGIVANLVSESYFQQQHCSPCSRRHKNEPKRSRVQTLLLPSLFLFDLVLVKLFSVEAFKERKLNVMS